MSGGAIPSVVSSVSKNSQPYNVSGAFDFNPSQFISMYQTAQDMYSKNPTPQQFMPNQFVDTSSQQSGPDAAPLIAGGK